MSQVMNTGTWLTRSYVELKSAHQFLKLVLNNRIRQFLAVNGDEYVTVGPGDAPPLHDVFV